MVLFIYLFFLRTIGLRFSLYQKLSKLCKTNLVPLFCHEIGYENDQTYIFRFVRYLSTFFYTYLPVNIHFQLIIITNVSILTNPAYFVLPSCHCDILALRSRYFWVILTAKHVFGEKLENVEWQFISIGVIKVENTISS